MWRVICADVLSWCKNYTGEPFHAILCDPPYALKFMNKAWDNNIAFRPETWEALAEHLLPGGFVMAFASSRGWHRLACAMEDAGLIIQPSIFGWVNGQSFPKATRIDTQIDKVANRIGENVIKLKRAIRKHFDASGLTLKEFNNACGFEASGYLRESSTWATVLPSHEKWEKIKRVLNCNNNLDGKLDKWFREIEREVIGKSKWSHQVGIPLPNTYNGQRQHLDVTAPATNLARAWEGHRYGGQILKNALEPIIVAQKPWEGKRLDCIVETGAGALWVDGARIEGAKGNGVWGTNQINCQGTFNASPDNKDYHTQQHSQGRWPANFVLCHAEGCERVGVKRVKTKDGYKTDPVGHLGAFDDGQIYGKGNGLSKEGRKYLSDGLETIDAWECVPECPTRRLGEQSGELKSSKMTATHQRNSRSMYGQGNGQPTLHDTPGDKGTAARFFFQADWSHEVAERIAGADPVRYCPKAARKERDAGLDGIEPKPTVDIDKWAVNDRRSGTARQPTEWKQGLRRNSHPTVKPISLNKWLATLLLPPSEYAPRRILIPFFGSGSEGIGAGLAGWEEIIGIDFEQDYCIIAEARLEHWLGQPVQLELPP